MDDLMKKVEKILSKFNYDENSLIRILMETQDVSDSKYISEDTAHYIAKELGLPDNQVYEVLSFYSALNKSPKGKYHIELCDSTACRVNKKCIIEEYLEESLNISVGETTEDNLFTLDLVPCFGACDVSPAMRINKKIYGDLTVSKTKDIIEELRGESDE